MTEPRYTLEEARRELRKIDCERMGHNWNVIQVGDIAPKHLICERCGIRYDVVFDTTPLLP